MKLIDKDALVAEMEKRIKNLYPKGGQGMVVTKILKDHYEDLLSFIDSMQEEPKFKTGDRIKPIDSCIGSPRTIVDVCDGWYVTDQGTLDFEYEDNWELAEEPKKCMYPKDNYADKDRKVTCDGCEEDCKYAKLNTMLDDALSKETKESWNERLGKEEPVSEEWIEELRTKLNSMSKEDFKKVFDKYAIDFNEEPVSRTPADIEAAMQEVEEKSRAFTEAHHGEDLTLSLRRCAVKRLTKWWLSWKRC